MSELVNTCLSQPGLTTGQLLEHYRGTKEAATLEKLSMWDDIADKDIAEETFTDSLNHMFDSMLELRQEELIARERTHGLSSEERRELWMIKPGTGEKISERQNHARCNTMRVALYQGSKRAATGVYWRT